VISFRAKLAQEPAPVEIGLDELQQTWEAMTAETPEAFLQLLEHTPPDTLPLYRDALAELTGYYPSVMSGLPRWDECLLREIAAHPKRFLHAIGHTLCETFETFDACGDW
jgi:hypothetical protein